jgi:hypothetical protein
MQDKRRANEDLPLEILPALMEIHDVSVRMLGSALNIPDLPSPANDAFGEKRRSAAAVQDCWRDDWRLPPARSVLECASPLALSEMRQGVATRCAKR